MTRNIALLIAFMLTALCVPLVDMSVNAVSPEWGLYWQLRAFFVAYSGYVTMMLMSLTVILSVRDWPLERFLLGLDKQYRLHKYTGVAAVVSAFVHWLVFLSDDIAMEFGFVDFKEERYPFWKITSLLGEPAQLIGEWGFYIAAALVSIAWLKYFSFRTFEKTHRVFPYLYLILIVHMVTFFDASLWFSLSGFVLMLLSAVASVACLITILGRNGRSKQTTGAISSIKPISNGIRLCVKSSGKKPAFINYQNGQFAFLSFDQDERPHPFSVAGKKANVAELEFLIKANGDYTNTLGRVLQEGQNVTVEGPYGRFDFNDGCAQQLWIAGGIGIAPFLSALAHVSKDKQVALVYSFRDEDVSTLKELEKYQSAENITLRLINTKATKRFDSKELRPYLQTPSDISVWYCGPNIFGDAVEAECYSAGIAKTFFHRELFEFR